MLRGNHSCKFLFPTFLIALLLVSCGVQEQDGGETIPFTLAIGSYSGLCQKKNTNTNIHYDSIQTNVTVSALNLKTARFRSSCLPNEEILLDYFRTNGDSIFLKNEIGTALYLISAEEIQIIAIGDMGVNTLYTGQK